MAHIGFDNDAYLKRQSQHIRERFAQFDKLYLEFGGKLFDDFHASRVLPGFQPDSKVRMLLELADQAELVLVINADHIEKNKRRGDLGITYDLETLRLIDAFRGLGLYVSSVCLTQYAGQSAANRFQDKLEKLGIPTYRHYPIDGYPANISHIVSEAGFGKNEYIKTTRPLVVVTAPGPGSGKMATCLSQLYHEYRHGVNAGYAKFETFPIWNLPLKHPVNLAYEAATVDLQDVNMIDPFHLEAYGEVTVNYNRDVEIFPVVSAIFERIFGHCPYKSPTDMGVNMAGNCIVDDEVCREASLQEILRRYYATCYDIKVGRMEEDAMYRMELVMSQAGVDLSERRCVQPALDRARDTGAPATAIELEDGTIVTGKTSPLLGATSAALLNALKYLAGIDDAALLISPAIIEPIQALKVGHLGNHNPRLHTDETLLALAICAVHDPQAQRAVDQLPKLKGCEAHSTVILSQVDSDLLRKVGIRLTVEPVYQSKKLFHKQ
ncbi:MAG TPA: DUF1846 domain-containing protein [Candidatus Galloscillospira excrementipullorum]|nr:DUF1846 domain-containing protein [Candidatus Galloscillospira excrementipullorum]